MSTSMLTRAPTGLPGMTTMLWPAPRPPELQVSFCTTAHARHPRGWKCVDLGAGRAENKGENGGNLSDDKLSWSFGGFRGPTWVCGTSMMQKVEAALSTSVTVRLVPSSAMYPFHATPGTQG